jgi:hypothetical protein
MLDMQHFPGNLNNQRQQTFIGDNGATVATQWRTWVKPKGINWIHIYMVGKGGNGGTGVVGANSVSAGGGGGGSGGTSSILLPAWCVPDTLYISLAGVSATTTMASYIAWYPSTTGQYVIQVANGGGNGGNASAGTGGTAGSAAATVSVTSMLTAYNTGGAAAPSNLVGTVGGVGGAAVAAAALAMPTTGSRVMGGTGGGGLPAAAATGTVGGAITGAGPFPTIAAPAGQATATSPPNTPDNGYIFQPQIPGALGMYNFGGIGGGSTHGTATGGGLVQMKGGDGAPGCGGGGSGGALTGSTAAAGGLGGPAFLILTTW